MTFTVYVHASMPALRQAEALRAAAQADWAFRAAGDGLQWTEHTENQSVTVIRQRPTEKHTKDNCIDHAMNKSCSCCACAQLKHAACANWKCRCAIRLASVPSQCRGLSRVSCQCLPSFQNANEHTACTSKPPSPPALPTLALIARARVEL